VNAVAFVATSLATLWTALGTGATLWVTRPRRAPLEAPPPVTVLKPLAGADADLRANLEGFFLQDHPDFEILFGVERADDPAIPVVRALIDAHPGVAARLVVHGDAARGGKNPKVRNLRAMLPHARHDVVLVSDSNVRAPRDYVRLAALELARDPRVGLVTHLFVGSFASGARPTLGAALECVQLTGFCASGAALPTLLGDAAVIGKSMMFSRTRFEAIGGLSRVADVLAEDYVIGKMFQHAGYRVVVGETALEAIAPPQPLDAFVARQLRWSMLRARLHPAAFALELVSSPLAMLPFAWATLGPLALAWLAALLVLRDVVPWLRLKGARGIHAPLALGLARDVLAIGIWCAAPFTSRVSWRGHRVRVGAGTLLFEERPAG
jgi:ceramide glucosyltransferase